MNEAGRSLFLNPRYLLLKSWRRSQILVSGGVISARRGSFTVPPLSNAHFTTPLRARLTTMPQIKALVSGETRACGHRVARGWGAEGHHPAQFKSPGRWVVPSRRIFRMGRTPDPSEPATRAENAGGTDKVAEERNSLRAHVESSASSRWNKSWHPVRTGRAKRPSRRKAS